MKKKKVIISICLVIVLSMSAFVAVQATSGDENNIFEQLKALITGNTNRIEKLENEVDTLENEIDKLKGEITELQKPKEEEKATETEEKKETTTSNSNKKPTTNTTTKKPSTTTSNNTNKKPTTTDYQKQIDTLNKEISALKKSIEDLEKQDNKQTNEIETLKTELNNKSEELKKLINNSSSSSSSSNKNTITKNQLVGTWNFEQGITAIFKNDGTVIWNNKEYKYILNENWIFIKDKDTNKEVWAFQYEYKDNKFYLIGQGATATKTSNNTDITITDNPNNNPSSDKEQEELKQLEIKLFNDKFTQYTGAKNGSIAKQLVNEILSNNATNTIHQISIQYNDTIVTDFDELKNNLVNSNNYSISVEKDSTGYINKIIIK